MTIASDTTVLPLAIKKAQRERLVRQAQRHGLSASAMVRLSIAEKLEQLEREELEVNKSG